MSSSIKDSVLSKMPYIDKLIQNNVCLNPEMSDDSKLSNLGPKEAEMESPINVQTSIS
jgi:hypothetical protein